MHYRTILEVEKLRLAGGVTKDQRPLDAGAPYISAAGENPVEAGTNTFGTYTIHPSSPAAHGFQWYVHADDYNVLNYGRGDDPSKAELPAGTLQKNPRTWQKLDNVDAWGLARTSDTGTAQTTYQWLQIPNTYTILCDELDAAGKPLGTPTAVYRQVVLDPAKWAERELLSKHIKKVDEKIQTIDEATEVPIRGVLVTTAGEIIPLALFAGRSKSDPDKVRLLDLTPNTPKWDYDVDSLPGKSPSDELIRRFVAKNKYPEGRLTVDVPSSGPAIGLQVGRKTYTLEHEDPSFASKFSSISGWVSMGATALGFLALLDPFTAPAAPYLFGLGAGAGAASAGASLIARFQEGRATPTGVAIDLLALAANLLQIKTIQVQNRIAKATIAAASKGATIAKGVRYLLYTQLAIEGAEAVFIAADTVIQIDAILDDEDKSRGQKIDEIIRLLAQAAITGGLYIHGLRSARAQVGAPSSPSAVPSSTNRLRALDQSAEQFAQDADAQAELFAAAEKMSAQQNDLARRIHVEDVGGRGTVTISKTKRPTPAELRDAILDKMKDRKYKAVGEMDDIVRARYDAEDPADVEPFVKGLQQDPTFFDIQRPQAREGVAWGYPRYHVIMKDAETGLTHEWQIGTRASTELFERKGIRLGKLVLPKTPHASFGDLHDIEYDIFKKIQKAEPDVAAHFKIPEYRRELAEFSARTGLQRMDPDELERGIVEFHERASKILADLIDEKGLGYVESYQKK